MRGKKVSTQTRCRSYQNDLKTLCHLNAGVESNVVFCFIQPQIAEFNVVSTPFWRTLGAVNNSTGPFVYVLKRIKYPSFIFRPLRLRTGGERKRVFETIILRRRLKWNNDKIFIRLYFTVWTPFYTDVYGLHLNLEAWFVRNIGKLTTATISE